MNVQTSIPSAIWDPKKFHWKLLLHGKFESLNGCPNWLYERIRQIRTSGQAQDETIQVVLGSKYQYAVRFAGESIEIYSKKK